MRLASTCHALAADSALHQHIIDNKPPPCTKCKRILLSPARCEPGNGITCEVISGVCDRFDCVKSLFHGSAACGCERFRCCQICNKFACPTHGLYHNKRDYHPNWWSCNGCCFEICRDCEILDRKKPRMERFIKTCNGRDGMGCAGEPHRRNEYCAENCVECVPCREEEESWW